MSYSENKKSFGAWSPQGRIAHFKGPQVPEMLIARMLHELSQTPATRLEELVFMGSVYVNKFRVMDRSFIVKSDDIIRVHLEPKRYTVDKSKIVIVFEDENFVILNKPGGVPMHATLDNAIENLAASFAEKLFVTHRLDVPTSGVVLLAKNKDYQAVFNDLIARREVAKNYQALTIMKPEEGLLKHFMFVEARAPKKIFTQEEMAVNQARAEDPSLVKYDECRLEVLSTNSIDFDLGRVIEIRAPGFDSKINLLTGRTHQIRAQLSKVGCPIVGDEMYGGMPSTVFGLHACSLKFIDPLSKKKIEVEVPKQW